jgi:hypothetical protein
MMPERVPPMAMCPRCEAPLISTCVFSGYEFYCVECGNRVTFFGPRAAQPTPELDARHDALRAEWDEHAGRKLLVPRSWVDGCDLCRQREGDHPSHATDEERAADRAARAWLKERAAERSRA